MVHHPDGLTVLLAEGGHRAPRLGLRDGQLLGGNEHSPDRMASLTRSSTSSSCWGVMPSKWVKSKRRRSGSTREPA